MKVLIVVSDTVKKLGVTISKHMELDVDEVARGPADMYCSVVRHLRHEVQGELDDLQRKPMLPEGVDCFGGFAVSGLGLWSGIPVVNAGQTRINAVPLQWECPRKCNDGVTWSFVDACPVATCDHCGLSGLYGWSGPQTFVKKG